MNPDEIEKHPRRTDRREDWRKRIRNETERSEIDEINRSSIEFDGWRYDEGSIRIRRA
jgi:hypothetical protein